MHDAIGQSSNLKIENHGPDLSFNAQARLPGGVPSIFALSNTSACTHCLNCSTLCERFCQLQLPARQHFVCSTPADHALENRGGQRKDEPLFDLGGGDLIFMKTIVCISSSLL
jgi:hypothetical protein